MIYAPPGAAPATGVALALAAALLLAIAFVLTAASATRASALASSFHIALPGAIIGLMPTMLSSAMPAPGDLAALVGLGALSALTHFLIGWALRLDNSSLIISIGYAEIPFAVVYGMALFGQAPTFTEMRRPST